jgi:hypothetical protein
MADRGRRNRPVRIPRGNPVHRIAPQFTYVGPARVHLAQEIRVESRSQYPRLCSCTPLVFKLDYLEHYLRTAESIWSAIVKRFRPHQFASKCGWLRYTPYSGVTTYTHGSQIHAIALDKAR